jgi:hypothetical protein
MNHCRLLARDLLLLLLWVFPLLLLKLHTADCSQLALQLLKQELLLLLKLCK